MSETDTEVLVSGIPLTKLVNAYIKIRNKKSEIKAAFDEKYDALTADQDKIKNALLDYCREAGLDGFKTEFGTVSRRAKTRYWTSDWESMGKFVIEHNLPEFYQKALNQSNVAQFLEEHPDVTPPGLNVDSEYTITVTKPRRKT